MTTDELFKALEEGTDVYYRNISTFRRNKAIVYMVGLKHSRIKTRDGNIYKIENSNTFQHDENCAIDKFGGNLDNPNQCDCWLNKKD